MKKILFLIAIVSLLGCDSENSWDCFQAAGDIVTEHYEVDGFKKILVFNRVQLIISQGLERSVVIETGENLINEVLVRVEDSILKVSNRNSCNYVREYGITKVRVITPFLEEIQNSSGLPVISSGLISFPNLKLVSEDPELDDRFHKDGDFIMDNLDVQSLTINANGLSKFFLKGKAGGFAISAADSDVRVEAGELVAQSVFFFHRSTNKLIVNPQRALRGRIVSIGDVISKNRPPVVEVDELFRGRLIFE